MTSTSSHVTTNCARIDHIQTFLQYPTQHTSTFHSSGPYQVNRSLLENISRKDRLRFFCGSIGELVAFQLRSCRRHTPFGRVNKECAAPFLHSEFFSNMTEIRHKSTSFQFRFKFVSMSFECGLLFSLTAFQCRFNFVSMSFQCRFNFVGNPFPIVFIFFCNFATNLF